MKGNGRTTISGAWSGAYRYSGAVMPETVFNARIEEVGGAFTGSLQEPNTFGHDDSRVVTSDIEGVRTGQSVAFTKFYDGSGGMDHAIRYEGQANVALTRIDGAWTIPNDVSGAFFMVRDDDGEGVKAEEKVESRV